MKEAASRSQEEIVAQRLKEAKIKKNEALIKRERAYAEEEKSDETSEVSEKMDANKIAWEGSDKIPEEFYKANTANAVQNLENAIKTEQAMQERLENSEDKETAIKRKLDL